jgi:hypothetical protein
MKKTLIIVASLVILTACTKTNPQQIIIGHWRNDATKIDYIFGQDSSLKIVPRDETEDCTYEFSKQTEIENSLAISFKCPLTDWPGFVEEHTFDFSKDYSTFIDTKNIQGMLTRIDGNFYKVGEK